MPAYNFVDLVGRRFARLLVIRRASNRGCNTYWLCQCDCGNRIEVAGQHLKLGKTLSCKCLWENRTKHGMHQTREYRAWIDAKARCSNTKWPGYKHWGGRSITVCDGWKNDFEAFFRDMGLCPEGYELDRYPDNDGNYEPGNCRWVSHKENNRNKRTNRLITFNGETKTLAEWCEQVGIKDSTLQARLDIWHWPIEKALFSKGKRKWL